MTEREATRLAQDIRATCPGLRVDWIGCGPQSSTWELICTDARSGRQFVVRDAAAVSEYFRGNTAAAKQPFLF